MTEIDSLKIFEDEYLVVFDKPSGVHSVALQKGGGRSLADMILEFHPEFAAVSEKPEDAGLIQRLDYETSGVIIAAKTRETWIALREKLKAHEIAKEYLILVDEKLKEERTIASFLGSPKRHGKKVYSYKEHPGKQVRAIYGETRFVPEKIFESCTLVRAFAESATRHQVRAHAAHMGYPLTGDSLYGSRTNLEMIIGRGDLPAFFLHAEHSRFRHPVSDLSLDIAAPIPSRFSSLKS